MNLLPSKALDGVPPAEKLFGVTPDYKWLNVFGCLCYPLLGPYNKHKLQFRSFPCVFLGYAANHRGYKCLDRAGRIYISKHVRFDEKVFPYATSSFFGEFVKSVTLGSDTMLHVFRSSELQEVQEQHVVSSPMPSASPRAFSDMFVASDLGDDVGHVPYTADEVAHVNIGAELPSVPSVSTEDADECLNEIGHGVTHETRVINSHSMVTRSKSINYKLKVYSAFVSCAEPDNIHATMGDSSWQAAVNAELQALHNNNTWTLVVPPASRVLVGCKWIFKLKKNPYGSIARHKARLVAQWYSQAAS